MMRAEGHLRGRSVRLRTLVRACVAGSATLALLVAAALVSPSAALAKSFAVDEVAIRASVAIDGSVTVTERRTMTFDGDYSRVYWVIPTSGVEGIDILGAEDDAGTIYRLTNDESGIDDRAARVPGTMVVRQTSDAVEVHLFHNAADSTRTFILNYRVRGGAKRWADTSELYWKLIGEGWDVGTRHFVADIKLPGVAAGDQVRVWAHGPLTGEVSKSATGGIHLVADDVPANTFVEVRALFPQGALTEVAASSDKRVDSALTEEARWAGEANRLRRSARWGEALRTVGAWLIVLLSCGAVAWTARTFIRRGREYTPQFQGQYFREDPRPELPPSVVGAFLHAGKPQNSDVAAMLMDLSDKGVVRMAPVVEESKVLFVKTRSETYRLAYAREKENLVAPYDRALCEFLFFTIGSDGIVTLEEIEDYGRAHAQEFVDAMNEWKSSVEGHMQSLGLYEPQGQEAGVITIIAAVLVGVGGGVALFFLERFVFMFVPILAGIIMGIFAIFMSRRSREGAELSAKYEALKRFLKDFSRLKEAPPASVVLWNRYLVLAVVFGIADEVIDQLRVTMPQVVQDPAFQNMYWWVYAGPRGMSPVAALSTNVVSTAQVAASKMASASGGGGGFSVGGGGGFGGGGGGAD